MEQGGQVSGGLRPLGQASVIGLTKQEKHHTDRERGDEKGHRKEDELASQSVHLRLDTAPSLRRSMTPQTMVDGHTGGYHDEILADQDSSCEQDQRRLISGADGFEVPRVSPVQMLE